MSLGLRCAHATSTLLAVKVVLPSARLVGRRALHATVLRNVISSLAMPAMSPTMTEGGIAQWKVKEGEVFHAGDVLLEVETDKATIEVEAQEEGVLGKIIAPDGSKNVSVGKTIALIAEEGDDISNLEAPKDELSSAFPKPPEELRPESNEMTQPTLQQPTPQPVHRDIEIRHSKPLFPSVQRLLIENGITDADQIKGTGVRGMLTKGDVLAFLGKASSPLGTLYNPAKPEPPAPTQTKEPLDGEQVRRIIAAALTKASPRAPTLPPAATPHDFDSIVNDYLPSNSGPSVSKSAPSEKPTASRQGTSVESYFQGLL